METTVNAILREWRDLWPGGLEKEQYSTLNLIAQCRQGTLGYPFGTATQLTLMPFTRTWSKTASGNPSAEALA